MLKEHIVDIGVKNFNPSKLPNKSKKTRRGCFLTHITIIGIENVNSLFPVLVIKGQVLSESELGEQEFGGLLGFGTAGGSVVSGLEEFLEVLLHLGSSLSVVHLIFRDGALEVNVFLNHESCGQQVVVVDKLDEGDETRSALNLLLAHGLGNLSRVLSDTSNESVGEFLVL